MALDANGSVSDMPVSIPGNTRANVTTTWVFAIIWNLVSLPLLVIVPRELSRKPLAALGFLFPIVGIGLIAWALIMTARARRFGATHLDLAAPARAGGVLEGTLHTQLPSPDAVGAYAVTIKLTCLQRTISGSDDDRSEHERILWRDEAEAASDAIRFTAEGASLPVRFAIPADARATTAVGKGPGSLWVLTAQAALPGVDLKEDFDVVVRGAEDIAAGDTARPGLRSPAAVTLDDLARGGIHVAPGSGGMTYTFGAFRNRSFTMSLTALTAVWTGSLWLQWYLQFPIIFPIVTGFFELILIAIVVDLWLGSTIVTVGSGTVRRQHRVLGVTTTREIAAPEIARLDLHINMQTEGRYGTPYYELRATLTSGRKLSLGSGIRNKRHAEWLATQLRSDIGVRAA